LRFLFLTPWSNLPDARNRAAKDQWKRVGERTTMRARWIRDLLCFASPRLRALELSGRNLRGGSVQRAQ